MILKEGKAEQFEKIITTGKVCAIFSAEWCPPCKMLKQRLGKLEETLSAMKDDADSKMYAHMKDIQFYLFDVEKIGVLASKESIRSIPTVRFYHNGTLINKHLGDFRSDKEMLEFFITV